MRTAKLREIMVGLKALAEDNANRAYRILGAHPGPGIDLLIQPSLSVVSNEWKVSGSTACGAAFVDKFWRYQPLTNQKVAEMRKQAIEWGLTFVVELPVESLDDRG